MPVELCGNLRERVSPVGIGTHNICYVHVDNNGHSDTAMTQVEVEVCGAIASLQPDGGGLGVRVWPNPADEVIHLEWAGSDETEVRVWSSTGRLISQTPITFPIAIGNQLPITKNWPAGVYVAEMRTLDRVWREKIVVK